MSFFEMPYTLENLDLCERYHYLVEKLNHLFVDFSYPWRELIQLRRSINLVIPGKEDRRLLNTGARLPLLASLRLDWPCMHEASATRACHASHVFPRSPRACLRSPVERRKAETSVLQVIWKEVASRATLGSIMRKTTKRADGYMGMQAIGRFF